MHRYELLLQFFGLPSHTRLPHGTTWVAVVSRHQLPKPTWVLVAGEVVVTRNGKSDWRAREHYVKIVKPSNNAVRFQPASRRLEVPPLGARSALRAGIRRQARHTLSEVIIQNAGTSNMHSRLPLEWLRVQRGVFVPGKDAGTRLPLHTSTPKVWEQVLPSTRKCLRESCITGSFMKFDSSQCLEMRVA